ncbi:aldehyde dehydrogenase family protein [Actinoallomurus sp. NPDC050550]|uniref:aldehyde dehydrogenase family protein n=1 Tax=Actinoallomurus sp. NPDC050550 TaxID=3154937 RepID=UPI0033F46A2A
MVTATTRWRPPGGWIASGRWRDDGNPLVVSDQQNGARVETVVDVAPEVVDQIVAAASAAVPASAEVPAHERRRVLAEAGARVERDAESFAQTLVAEGSKTIREARREVARCVTTLRLAAEEAGRLTGETIAFDGVEAGVGRIGWWMREPVGVVAAITPFNDALNLVAHKIGPAIAAGNVTVLKPSEHTPLSALRLAEALLDAGLPGDMLSVVPGGAPTAQALVAHPAVDAVSFTGGYRTGAEIARSAGPKRMVMELGGNCPVIVLSDADLKVAAAATAAGAFSAAGQNCLSVQRVYVERSVAPEFTERLVARTEALRCGDKYDELTDVGPLIDGHAARRVRAWIDEAVRAGARLRVGGDHDGAFIRPAVLDHVPEDARVLREEVFGPVVSVIPVDGPAEAVAMANDSLYGLHAGLFTQDVGLALALASRLRVGGVMINDSSDFRIDSMPFGGRGHSGVGREGVRYAIEALTEPKVVAVRVPSPAPAA